MLTIIYVHMLLYRTASTPNKIICTDMAFMIDM